MIEQCIEHQLNRPLLAQCFFQIMEAQRDAGLARWAQWMGEPGNLMIETGEMSIPAFMLKIEAWGAFGPVVPAEPKPVYLE